MLGASKHKDRFAMFANIDFRNVGPGFGQMAAEQLEADVKAGAVGLGEIMKDFGLTARKADGTRLKLDDPELDPIWADGGAAEHPGDAARRRSGAVLGRRSTTRTSASSRWRCSRTAAARPNDARRSKS